MSPGTVCLGEPLESGTRALGTCVQLELIAESSSSRSAAVLASGLRGSSSRSAVVSRGPRDLMGLPAGSGCSAARSSRSVDRLRRRSSRCSSFELVISIEVGIERCRQGNAAASRFKARVVHRACPPGRSLGRHVPPSVGLSQNALVHDFSATLSFAYSRFVCGASKNENRKTWC